MNKFKEIKSYLTNKEVVQRYLGNPEKITSTGIWYKSPFRKERTASFCVSEKGIHDFGDSKHYDVISFVESYFNVMPLQALDILCNDFGLSINNPYKNEHIVKMLKKKREEEKEIKEKTDKWFTEKMQKICDDLQEIRKMINFLSDTTYFETLCILYDQESKLEIFFEQLIEICNDEEKKTSAFLEDLKNDRRR